MKKLLLFLSILAFHCNAQIISGEGGGTVDNAAVATATDTNPRNIRESLELPGLPSTSSGNRLFWTEKKLETSRQTTVPLVLNTLTIGDSWAHDANQGLLAKFGSFGQVTMPSWALLNGTATLSAAYGDYPLSPWGGQYITLSSNTSSHATFGLISQTTTRLNSIRYAVVFYEGQTAGNSFTVQYEDLAGAFQTLATVSTDSVATSGLQVYESAALPYSLATRIRVVWASGSPKICAAGGTNNPGNLGGSAASRTGVVTCNTALGGSTIAQMASTSQASWNTMLGWLKPDIVFIREKPEVAVGSWTPNFTQLVSRVRAAYPSCDIVLIGRHITDDGSEAGTKEVDDWLREYAADADNAATFVDIIRYMPETITKSRDLGINRIGEGVHLARYGDVMVAEIVFSHVNQVLDRFVNSHQGSYSYAPKTMGSGFQGVVPIYFDGTLSTGTGGFTLLDTCGGNTINHKTRFGFAQSGYGMTGTSIYNEGWSFSNGGQSWLKFDSQARAVWSQVAFNTSRIPLGRLEMHSGGGAQTPFAITVPTGQTADMLPFYTGSTAAVAGTLASRFDFAGNLKFEVAGLGVTMKQGANALAGTVVLTAGAGTITSTAIDANTVIMLSLKTSSGTPGMANPRVDVASGSATVTGVATDGSTYNWAAIKTTP